MPIGGFQAETLHLNQSYCINLTKTMQQTKHGVQVKADP